MIDFFFFSLALAIAGNEAANFFIYVRPAGIGDFLCFIPHVFFSSGHLVERKNSCYQLISYVPFKWLQIEFRATEGAAVPELIILHVKIKMMYFWDLM